MNTNGVAVLGFTVLIGFLLTWFRFTRYLGVAAVLVGIGVTAFYWWQAQHWGFGYEQLHVDSTEREVVKIFGSPPRVTDGTEGLYPGVKRAPSTVVSGCVKEYWYGVFLFPTVFDFCFDNNSRLVNKSYMTSY